MESTGLDNWVINMINTGLRYGGEQVTEDHYQARADICKGCDYIGEVLLPDFSKVQGCTLCGCPTQTKPRWRKYFSFKELKIVEAVCPDTPNRWAEIDDQFFNQNSN